MDVTLDMLDKIAGKAVSRPNANALIAGLAAYPAGLDKPHRRSVPGEGDARERRPGL